MCNDSSRWLSDAQWKYLDNMLFGIFSTTREKRKLPGANTLVRLCSRKVTTVLTMMSANFSSSWLFPSGKNLIRLIRFNSEVVFFHHQNDTLECFFPLCTPLRRIPASRLLLLLCFRGKLLIVSSCIWLVHSYHPQYFVTSYMTSWHHSWGGVGYCWPKWSWHCGPLFLKWEHFVMSYMTSWHQLLGGVGYGWPQVGMTLQASITQWETLRDVSHDVSKSPPGVGYCWPQVAIILQAPIGHLSHHLHPPILFHRSTFCKTKRDLDKLTCLYDIYVIPRLGGPYREKLCPRSWGRPYSSPRAQFFPIRTDLSWWITFLFFSVLVFVFVWGWTRTKFAKSFYVNLTAWQLKFSLH